MKIDFDLFFKSQSLEETIAVLDEMLCILVMHTEYAGLSGAFSHQYLTIRNLRDTFARQRRDKVAVK